MVEGLPVVSAAPEDDGAAMSNTATKLPMLFTRLTLTGSDETRRLISGTNDVPGERTSGLVDQSRIGITT